MIEQKKPEQEKLLDPILYESPKNNFNKLFVQAKDDEQQRNWMLYEELSDFHIH